MPIAIEKIRFWAGHFTPPSACHDDATLQPSAASGPTPARVATWRVYIEKPAHAPGVIIPHLWPKPAGQMPFI